MSKPDDDGELFRTAMRDVRRLQSPHAPRTGPKPRPSARFTRADEREVLRETLLPAQDPAALETGDELAYRRTDVPAAVLQKLRRGEYAVEAEFDLHGMTVAEARTALGDFIAEAQSRRWRCIRIIHGKGRRSGPRGPVLKNLVNNWLRRSAAVRAFGSARNIDGGSGAVYVLLS